MNDGVFYIVYDWMVKGIKAGAERDVYALLYALARNDGTCSASQAYIVERTGYARTAVQSAIKKLSDKGYILANCNKGGKYNTYTIIQTEQDPKCEHSNARNVSIASPKCEHSNARNVSIASPKCEHSNARNVSIASPKCEHTPYIKKENKDNNISLIRAGAREREREFLLKFLILRRKIKNAQEELNRFTSHYAAQGWKRANGQSITDKLETLKAWDIKNAVLLTQQEYNTWRGIIERADKTGNTLQIIDGIKDILQIDDSTICLQITPELQKQFDEQNTDIINAIGGGKEIKIKL